MTEKNTIPPRYIEFCQAVAQLAASMDLARMGLTFRPGYTAGDWSDEIQMNWESGRHGDEMLNLRITSTVLVRAKIEYPAPAQAVQPSMICPTCKADLFKEDCKGARMNCPMTIARAVQS